MLCTKSVSNIGNFDSEYGIVAPLLLAPLSSAVKALCEASFQVPCYTILHEFVIQEGIRAGKVSENRIRGGYMHT